jgi:dTDP-4-amino-4,6-dideoxygalactose transaminase
MNIPFVDLYAQYQTIKKDIDIAIEKTILNSAYIGGEAIKDFEKSFANFIGVNQIVACANGTDSIEIILKALGIGEGDEVIVPAISWISTSEAVGNIGAIPVFVDVDEAYFTIDVSLIEKAITSNTKAIIPVHLYGQMVNMDALMNLAQKHQLYVIEDCAQAHGAEWNGKKAGTFGVAASFSFYPGKNLGAYGDAGCIGTNEFTLSQTCRMIANHGQLKKHEHLMEGRNSRMDGLQASILNAKLPYLNGWLDKRIEIAKIYTQKIKSTKVATPIFRNEAKHVFHLYVLKTNERSILQKLLNDKGVETAIHYPTALPFLPAYAQYNFSVTQFPVAAKLQHQILSLPIYPELELSAIEYITDCINTL